MLVLWKFRVYFRFAMSSNYFWGDQIQNHDIKPGWMGQQNPPKGMGHSSPVPKTMGFESGAFSKLVISKARGPCGESMGFSRTWSTSLVATGDLCEDSNDFLRSRWQKYLRRSKNYPKVVLDLIISWAYLPIFAGIYKIRMGWLKIPIPFPLNMIGKSPTFHFNPLLMEGPLQKLCCHFFSTRWCLSLPVVVKHDLLEDYP